MSRRIGVSSWNASCVTLHTCSRGWADGFAFMPLENRVECSPILSGRLRTQKGDCL